MPKGTEELNIGALRAGFELAEVAMAQRDARKSSVRKSSAGKAEALEDARKARKGRDDGRYR